MTKTKKILLFVLVISLLSIPTFLQMVRPGIFSTQDFHYFRLVEFDKCIRALQIPCRWAPDAGAGFGEPVFNFYGQAPYIIGEILHLLTVTKIDALKITFIFSLVGSAIGMFFLARKIWQDNLAALVSSVIYLYAPYRAVDVWVRGALPEAVSFVFFPLIILSVENYLEKRNKKHLLLFSLAVGLLIISHNLSVILFAPFLITWIIFRLIQSRNVKSFVELGIAGLFSVLLSAFYILPVIFESKFIDINATTLGVYDWRANFVTVYQLFISRFWGYGGSTWGSGDGLSLAVGLLQWLIPAITFCVVILSTFGKLSINSVLSSRAQSRDPLRFFKGFLHFGRNDMIRFTILLFIGLFCLFLTHNKSTFIWNLLPFMKYIQFPWRFLGTATFAFALAGGYIVAVNKNKKIQRIVTGVIILLAIGLNFNFFRPDIWYKVTDIDMESGARWTESMWASLPDYWPNLGHKIPSELSDGKYINYFPGWNKTADKNGLIPAKGAFFSDTPVRTIGNLISLGSFGTWVILFVKLKYAKNN